MESQTANTFLMVQPVAFGFNQQTAGNNYFQQRDNVAASAIQQQALEEFLGMKATLQDKGIRLIIATDATSPHTPDSIFPSNWVSFHSDGTVAVYPMFAVNRRLERRADVLKQINQSGFAIHHIVDYSHFENEQLFLEGTGSMVLDRKNRIAYTTLSERTYQGLVQQFCNDFRFESLCFHACQQVGDRQLPIYHTNVVMSVWDNFAVVCLDAVDDASERKTIVGTLQASGKEVIAITEPQMHCFAGNMIQVENSEGGKWLVMSQTAYQSLTQHQRERLGLYNPMIIINIPTIEKYGGGSVRCMMAEIFLPQTA